MTREVRAALWVAPLVAAALASTANAAPAVQDPVVAVPRPSLPEGADTNDPRAYLSLAALQSFSNEAVAESAFVWASRLAPGNADPPYQWAIMIIHRGLSGILLSTLIVSEDLRHEISRERVRMVDSLLRQAWLRDPFRDPLLDPSLRFAYRHPPTLFKDPITKGFDAYFSGDFPGARASWGRALAKQPGRADLRFHRAYTYYLQQRFDSAAGELEQAITAMGRAESSSLVRLAPPRALFYYAIGVARQEAGDYARAREAYIQALSENLGLYIAHARLAQILFAQGDSAGGLSELAIATGIEPGDAWLRNYHGLVLLAAGHPRESLAELEGSLAADRYYATPWYLLGRAHETLEEPGPARDAYREFLAHAAVSDTRWAWTRNRLGELQALLADSVGH